jgi:hypothetical protein
MRINEMGIGQDYVDWAVTALVDGFDSPSLAILAGLDTEGVVYRLDGELYFQRVAQELGWQFPDDETVLRWHLDEIARRISLAAIDPVTGIKRIHEEVVVPLGYPSDLRSWYDLWEQHYGFGCNVDDSDEGRATAIVAHAATWIKRLDIEQQN